MTELRSERLLLRRWRDDDRAAFAALNRDPRVVEHLPGPLTRAESDAVVDRIEAHFEQHGFGKWAVEEPGDGVLVGCVGLERAEFAASFTPAVEIGWRLTPACWGRGYATEAARRVLEHAFGPLGLDEVVSFTVPANVRSMAVMERIGLRRVPGGEFDHPKLEEGHRLRRHILYRVDRAEGTRSRR